MSRSYLAGDMVPVRCHASGSQEVRRAAYEACRPFATPPTQRQREAWLAEMSVITARRDGDEAVNALTLRAYSDRLGAYPADIVRHVLLVVARQWWPTWAELKRDLDAASAGRRIMLAALAAPDPAPVVCSDGRKGLGTLPDGEAAEYLAEITARVASAKSVKPI